MDGVEALDEVFGSAFPAKPLPWPNIALGCGTLCWPALPRADQTKSRVLLWLTPVFYLFLPVTGNLDRFFFFVVVQCRT